VASVRYRSWLAALPPMESLYQQMLNWAAAKGLGKHPAPLEYARYRATIIPRLQLR